MSAVHMHVLSSAKCICAFWRCTLRKHVGLSIKELWGAAGCFSRSWTCIWELFVFNLWGATGCFFLALEKAFGTFLCPNYGVLDAFLSLLEMYLGIVCVQAMGLWGAGCVFLALDNAFGMFLCPMAFCLCMRKVQKRI